MKKFMKSNTFYMIISVIIAILLWVYVVYEVNPIYEMWVRDVPVSTINVSELFNEGTLKINGENKDVLTDTYVIDIKIRGKRNVVSSIDKNDISCVIDMITVDKAGSYTLRPSVDVSKSNIEIVKVSPSSIRFDVENIQQRDLQIELNTVGELPKGFTFENVKFSQNVKITGADSAINSVQSAQITLDFDSLKTTDTEKSLKIDFLDKNGVPVDDTQFNKTVEYVKVSFNLFTEKTVSVLLLPKYKDGIIENTSHNTVELSVDDENVTSSGGIELRVKLKGTANALEKYEQGKTEVYTTEIDVTNIFYDQILYDIEAAPLVGNVDYTELPKVNVKAKIIYRDKNP
ncbi:MAG: hypothetical protein II998_06710 [Clostridia bacterium]|nr:hypothetical protein [Clostridia bacterium]